MIYAPILIPTLCRDKHFIRCIESLKKNKWAKYTDVYIALDYPTKESHWEGYNKICEYLNGEFNEFAAFNIIKREHNYGAVRNMRELRNDILKKYDRFIRTDDDCEFSPNFLEYMDKCLEKYQEDDSVLGVTGYSYPVKWNILSSYNTFKNSLIFPMWGTGFWRDKYIKMQNDIENGYIREKFQNKKNNMTDARYLDCINNIYNYGNDNLLDRATDVACGCYMQLIGKSIITPIVSKVRNYGFDGSGLYCQDTVNDISKKNASCYDYRLQEIDQQQQFTPTVEEHYDFESNKILLNQFDSREKKLMIKSLVKFRCKKLIITIIGQKMFRKLWSSRN